MILDSKNSDKLINIGEFLQIKKLIDVTPDE